MIGFDGTEDGLKAIKSGKLDATVAQKPTEMGRLALQTAYDFFNLKDVQAKVDSPLELIEKINKIQKDSIQLESFFIS